MWGGRFTTEASSVFKAFNDSLPVDYQLVEQDIEGSVAWANSLYQVGIFDKQEVKTVKSALNEILQSVRQSPETILASEVEDIHTWVELQLVDKVGDLGKRLHTGRSRNDQVLTDVKLWCKKQTRRVSKQLKRTILQLDELSQQYADTLMPSYTHLQRAQPITFGFWLDAAAKMFARDLKRLQFFSELADECPLGASAIAGTAFNIDRDQLAISLGFSQATHNALDTVSDRDFVVDIVYAGCSSLLHLSRLCEDLIFFNTQEAGFVIFDDSVTSGSSLMPQKKNPDALELIRGKSAEGVGHLSQILMALKSLPLGYNKDLQQDKSILFQALKSWFDSLVMFQQVVGSMMINKETMSQAVEQSFANATELADYLVNMKIPFRDAHEITGRLVLLAEQSNCYLHQLSLEQLQSICPLINEDVYTWLDSRRAIERRQVKGGVGYYYQQAKWAMEYRLTDAEIHDVSGIHELVSYWSIKGENLPLSTEEILNQLSTFKIIKDQDDNVLACGALHIYDESLVEIRSLGVLEKYQGKGFGKRLVYTLLAEAKRLNLNEVFVLTRQPEFFQACDFDSTTIDKLPKKVLKDCQFCPRKANCDEKALIYLLD
ncbi:argininosuccinate lyase [Pleionea sediminis]|uniref:argininosuccinate lyase n=1 Tax=Pleionea sediminis TaxID=2569479 RepID=UPI00118572E8|nr:argininosuccinate lyase [Pleionea sediminis]